MRANTWQCGTRLIQKSGTVAADAARAGATAAESEINAGRWLGPLHGVPVAVKDFYDTAFSTAAGVVASLGHIMKQTVVPFAGPSTDIRHFERDRKAISHKLFGEIDVVLLPTMTATVPRTSSAAANPQSLSPENTVLANYYGLPAISVPCGFDSNGLPIGLQIVAKPSSDLHVLALGQQYEATAGWFQRHPTT